RGARALAESDAERPLSLLFRAAERRARVDDAPGIVVDDPGVALALEGLSRPAIVDRLHGDQVPLQRRLALLTAGVAAGDDAVGLQSRDAGQPAQQDRVEWIVLGYHGQVGPEQPDQTEGPDPLSHMAPTLGPGLATVKGTRGLPGALSHKGVVERRE